MMEKIFGFYHIAAINDYEKLVNSQLTRLKETKLINKTDMLFITLIGGIDEEKNIRYLLKKLDINNFIIILYDDILIYEFMTLNLMQKLSLNEDFYCYYMHTKGVSITEKNKIYYNCYNYNYLRICVDEWREYMEYHIIDKHNECINELKEYDAVGCLLKQFPTKHFSGNFWWSKSDYIRKLTNINNLNIKDRYQAEFWIGMKNLGKLKSLHQPPNINHNGYINRFDFKYKI